METNLISNHNGLTCTVHSWDNWATIYDGDKPVGTMARPTSLNGKAKWEAFDLNGNKVTDSFYMQGCLNRFSHAYPVDTHSHKGYK